MPTSPTYPGVYIEEIPSGVRTITGVGTSVAAFAGYFSRGPMNEAVQLFSAADFDRQFGPTLATSEAGYAIQQFFLNGGGEAWAIRVARAGTFATAAIELMDAPGGTAILRASAVSAGGWGNNLAVDIDHPDANSFNLVVTEFNLRNGQPQPVRAESFVGLNLNPATRQYALTVVNNESQLLRLAVVGTPAVTARPAPTGTQSGVVNIGALVAGETMTVLLNGTALTGSITVPTLPVTAPVLASAIAAQLRALDAQLRQASVNLTGPATGPLLVAKAGTPATEDVLTFSGPLAVRLGLDATTRSNVQQYALGSATARAAQALPGGAQAAGTDGNLPNAADLIGNRSARTGIYALERVDLFNLLCLPDTMRLSDTEAAQVMSEANTYCEERRAFYIMDVPQSDVTRDEFHEVRAWLDANATLRHRNAALYFPRPRVADPHNSFRLRNVAPSGLMAGLYARTDSQRGVWKAPAGTDATLRGVQALETVLTDAENGALNPLGINCLRRLPVFGPVAWGARTLVGADALANEWKYVPVRRIALFIEESLFRGLKWVVFEPNDEPLWAQIRLNAGAFMQNLFRQGAFQGATPRDAYFVKCDKETTTQNDINQGIVNVVVGFAPLKPAEFVIIKLQQMAGQIAT